MLKVLLVTQEDPFYIPIFFKELFKRDISNKFVLTGVIVQPPLGKKSYKKLFKQMLDFYGFWLFFIVGIRFVLTRLLSFIAVDIFKGKLPGIFSTRHIILKNGVKIFEIKNINSEESINFLKNLNIDIIFSIAASQIFKKVVLELPKLGCYNIHTSKLPKNRGMMPNFWSLYNYDVDPVSAISIHKMNEELDDGEILIQKTFTLNPKESLDTLIRRTKKMSAEIFLEAIDIIERGNFELIKNDANLATYNTFPKREDVSKFKAKGLKL
jgi:methionyl-tRNA formyltransferase